MQCSKREDFSAIINQQVSRLKKEWQVRQDIHISHNAYPKYREKALYEFAESWNTTQEKFDFEERVNLIIYKRNL